jgi:hypothetical protein
MVLATKRKLCATLDVAFDGATDRIDARPVQAQSGL